jgi:2-(3-amino-3-carboxypropyl)histidine synthase
MIAKGTINRLKNLKAKRIFVQIPEGLKPRALEIVAFLERKGFEAVISTEPCFGACDLRDHEAKMLGCDAVLHVGHTDFGLDSLLPVVYEEWASDFDPVKVLRRHKIAYNSVGLLATAQHICSLSAVKRFLERKGKTALIGKGRGVRDGQVLGCNYSSARVLEGHVDCFLFIGSGSFHMAGLAEKTKKPIFSVDAESGKFGRFEFDRDKEEVRRRLRREKARGMQRFGIFISTKPGQADMQKALQVKKALEQKGKDTLLISADALSPEKIMGMGIQVLVNAACPRLYDDQQMFRMTILSPEDVELL